MSLTPPPPSPLVPGYRLDRYELLCPIAEGGMAQVWVARMRGKHGFEKLVAIKTILPKYASDLRFQHMFLDEARIAAGIEHVNVAQILDLGDEHDVLYLAMEWVDGDALTKIHRALEKTGQTIPMGVLLRVIADTCGGLHAAHELRGKDGVPMGVVHRDVSPQNILVSTAGVAKLIDFGIAKARDRVAGDTNTGFLKGKVQYMAPEQALGNPIDRRADIWALGAILYHYIASKPPFEGENQLVTLHKLASGKHPDPLPASVPEAVSAIVMRALSHDREKRFATVAQMQAAIETAMVTAKLSTTVADVAAFAEKHVGDRAAKRREAVDLALAAAAERARMQELLVPPNADSSENISDAGAKVRAVVLSPPRPVLSDSERAAPPTMPGVPGRMASDQALEDIKLPSPPSVPSSVTIGQAAIEYPFELLPKKRVGPIAIAVVGVVGIGLGVIATTALRGGPDAAAGGGGAPVATSAAVTTARPNIPPPPPVTATPTPTDAPTASAIASTAPSASPRPTSIGATPPRVPAAAPPTPPRPTTTSKIPKVLDNGF